MPGKLIVISAPSGGGKNTIVDRLLQVVPSSARLVTTTTRQIRPKEQDGVDYFFISKEEFQDLIERDALVEYNEYVGNFYGVQKKHLAEFLEKYDVVFTTLDVHGKMSLDKLGIKHTSVFLLPESFEILKERIEGRGGTTLEQIEKRIQAAQFELEIAEKYDHQIHNIDGQIQDTVDKVLLAINT